MCNKNYFELPINHNLFRRIQLRPVSPIFDGSYYNTVLLKSKIDYKILIDIKFASAKFAALNNLHFLTTIIIVFTYVRTIIRL